MSQLRSAAVLAMLLIALSAGAARSASSPQDSLTGLVDDIAMRLDPRVSSAMTRIDGTGRRLLALRSYLRAGSGLVSRWSWTDEQIVAFEQSAESRALQAEIERIRQAFAQANPGYELWVNPQVRSLDIQLANWNRNESVAQAAAGLQAAVSRLLQTRSVARMRASARRAEVEKFLMAFVPSPIPTIAAPGLSPHGQMRAIDFQVQKDDRIVAGPDTSTVETAWNAAGWTQKLKAAVSTSSSFTGPLETPREPWHYTFKPRVE